MIARIIVKERTGVKIRKVTVSLVTRVALFMIALIRAVIPKNRMGIVVPANLYGLVRVMVQQRHLKTVTNVLAEGLVSACITASASIVIMDVRLGIAVIEAMTPLVRRPVQLQLFIQVLGMAVRQNLRLAINAPANRQINVKIRQVIVSFATRAVRPTTAAIRMIS